MVLLWADHWTLYGVDTAACMCVCMCASVMLTVCVCVAEAIRAMHFNCIGSLRSELVCQSEDS